MTYLLFAGGFWSGKICIKEPIAMLARKAQTMKPQVQSQTISQTFMLPSKTVQPASGAG